MYKMCDLHVAREYHKDAVLIQLREGARETVQNNRLKLCSILETIILGGRQNIALRVQ